MKRKRVSINVIILAASLLLSVIMVFGLYFLIQRFISSNISVIEKNIQNNETKYWVNYIENTYQYTMENLNSIQKDTELINDIESYKNITSVVNKVQYLTIINSKLTSIIQRFEGTEGITIVMSNGNQICGMGHMIASAEIQDIIGSGKANQVQLFSSTLTQDGRQNLLTTKNEYRYITVNLYKDSAFVASLFVFINEDKFWGDLYNNNTKLLITDRSGNEIINTFGGREYKPEEIDTVVLPNGWIMKKGNDEIYLKTINHRMIAYLTTSVIFFMAFSFCLSLLMFRKPFSGIGEFRKFISRYNPSAHPRFKSRQSNIGRKLLQYFTLSVIVPSLVLFIAFSFWYRNQVENMIIDKYSNIVDTAANNIKKVVDIKKTIFTSLLYDYDFQTYIFNRQKFLTQHNESYINEVLYKYAELDLKEYNITVYDNRDKMVFTNSNDAQSGSVSVVDTGGSYSVSRNEYGQTMLSVYMNFGDIYSTNVPYQYHGKMDIPLSDLYDYYQNLNDANSQIYIIGPHGSIITSNLKDTDGYSLDFRSDRGVNRNNKTNKIIFYSKIGDMPWFLTLIYDFNFFTNEVGNYISTFVSILVIILLLTFIIISFLADLIRKPLLKLSASLKSYNAFADTGYVESTSKIKEIDDMTEQFNDLLDRIDELYDELILSANEKNQVLKKMHKAELTALQSQINPHFLSNTLENLISLIDNDHKEKAINVVNLLSTQFRVGISRKNKEISLREEIIYTKAYIEILKIRFDDNIHFEWVVDESMLDYQIIKLVLQPLVENAVRHGLGNRKTTGGRIVITAEMASDDISLTVADNGSGIDEEKLKTIRERLSDDDNFEDHIGLYNVHCRLKLMYGPGYGVSISSGLNSGTQVRILLPATVASMPPGAAQEQ